MRISDWSSDVCSSDLKDYDQIGVLLDYYRPLKDALGAVDIVEAAGPLDAYKLVVAPSLNIITDDQAAKFTAYVKAGGNLILGPRSAMKPACNRLDLVRRPARHAELLCRQAGQSSARPITGPAG